ncbi:MAG: hypothetical protein FWE05_08670 [Defluviitaleaceae bacterium]|nr:hypothetical protein [Defluviitaleaceae bacterium]
MRHAHLGIIGGLAVGLIVGAGLSLSADNKQRHRMMRNSKRALRKAGHYFEDIF